MLVEKSTTGRQYKSWYKKHDEQAQFVLQHTVDSEFAVVEEGKVVQAGIGAVDEGSDEIDNRIGEAAKRVFPPSAFLGNQIIAPALPGKHGTQVIAFYFPYNLHGIKFLCYNNCG